MSKLNPLSNEALCKLSNLDLCDRMDIVLYEILNESYTDPRAIYDPRQSIKEFFNTKKIQSLSEKHQRDTLRKCYEYLVQHEYLSRASGWLNEAVYGSDYNESDTWLSPRKQSINCAVDHIKIICSGIACERLMDLLHIIETEKEINDKKSKFKPFKKWLLDPTNRFVFFAPNLVKINKFRLKLRTAEAHAWSSLPNKLLQLQQPSHKESNEPLALLNILCPMWNPLLDLLNDHIPSSTAGSGAELDWLQAINNKDITAIESKLKQIDAEISDSTKRDES